MVPGRASEGWRPCTGGGMHDPASITGGHHDHRQAVKDELALTIFIVKV